jgi:hypothetical protein
VKSAINLINAVTEMNVIGSLALPALKAKIPEWAITNLRATIKADKMAEFIERHDRASIESKGAAFDSGNV